LKERIRILFVEDNLDDFELVTRQLLKDGIDFSIQRVESEDQFKLALRQGCDAILSDYSLPRFSVFRALEIIREAHLDIPFIIISGAIAEETAAEIMKLGVNDYILKDKLVRLSPAIIRELGSTKERSKSLDIQKTLKQTEEQLRHVQKMEAVGHLAGSVAHDFNNLLTIIKIYCGKLIKDNPTHAKEYAEKILKVSDKSANLTRQLSIISRIKPIKPENYNATNVILELQDMVKKLVGENVHVNFHLSTDLKSLLAEQGQLEQIILNLVINAKDAISHGGEITISTENKTFTDREKLTTGLLEPNEYVLIKISDTGVGIKDEVIGKIFEPYFTTKESGRGSGLGLSIVYGIVHQLEGRIRVESVEGQGTTFEVYLPVSHKTNAPVVSISKPETNLRGDETILLIESDEELLNLFSEILENSGYRVLKASNEEAATEYLSKSPGEVDLVIADIMTPKIQAFKIQRLGQQTNKAMKFIYLSGFFGDHERNKSFFKSNVFLEKPFSDLALLEKVRQVLDN
jgi:signal transduction histidine kinase